MMEPHIIETLELPHGLEVDIDEGWSKIVERQFAGDPGRALCELVQNALDSYPPTTPSHARRVEIETTSSSLAVADHGEGMDRHRLALLLMLGGSDKRGDAGKIGRFGIGFFSIFHPVLRTNRVTVTTCCEGQVIELSFVVKEAGKRPEIVARLLDTARIGTRIEIAFDDLGASRRCLQAARGHLAYYPCHAFVDGQEQPNAWATARSRNATFFAGSGLTGFLADTAGPPHVTVLRRHERITQLRIGAFAIPKPEHDLRDLHAAKLPYVPNTEIVVDSQDLRVTISRDAYYFDSASSRMINTVRDALVQRLLTKLETDPTPELVIANHFALAPLLGEHLTGVLAGARWGDAPVFRLRRILCEAKVYRIADREEPVSLLWLARARRPNIPIYYSSFGRNLRWLGGNFEHDFIVLPPRPPCPAAPAFFQTVFGIVGDAIDLETAPSDRELVTRLCDRGLIPVEALRNDVKLLDTLEVDPTARRFLSDLDEILADERVIEAVANAFDLPPRQLRSTFFEVHEHGVAVSSALLHEDGRCVAGTVDEPILLGLRLSDPLVRRLIASVDPLRPYFALSCIARRLADCQDQLVSHGRTHHRRARERLIDTLRHALLERLDANSFERLPKCF